MDDKSVGGVLDENANGRIINRPDGVYARAPRHVVYSLWNIIIMLCAAALCAGRAVARARASARDQTTGSGYPHLIIIKKKKIPNKNTNGRGKMTYFKRQTELRERLTIIYNFFFFFFSSPKGHRCGDHFKRFSVNSIYYGSPASTLFSRFSRRAYAGRHYSITPRCKKKTPEKLISLLRANRTTAFGFTTKCPCVCGFFFFHPATIDFFIPKMCVCVCAPVW